MQASFFIMIEYAYNLYYLSSCPYLISRLNQSSNKGSEMYSPSEFWYRLEYTSLLPLLYSHLWGTSTHTRGP